MEDLRLDMETLGKEMGRLVLLLGCLLLAALGHIDEAFSSRRVLRLRLLASSCCSVVLPLDPGMAYSCSMVCAGLLMCV